MDNGNSIPLVCFIDLLGTKESSKVSEQVYYNAITDFHKVLYRNKDILSEGYKIKGFSDCAFMSFNTDINTFKYLNRIREDLFAKKYYFKCSIVKVDFDVQVLGSSDSDFSCVTFGPKSVDAYLMHERYKGIGFILDQELQRIEEFKQSLVPSIYLEDEKKMSFNKCWDIKYSKSYVGNHKFMEEKTQGALRAGEDNHSAEENINTYIKQFVIALTKNKKYSKYYFPALVSIINSSDFSNISYSDTEGWTGVPVIFYKIFVDRAFDKKVAVVSGSEILFYVALNKVYQDISFQEETDKWNDDPVLNKLASIIVRKSRIKNFITQVPAFVFKHVYQRDFISRMAEIELRIT